MSRFSEEERKEIRQAFADRVNLQPNELEEWLETEESKSVGDESDTSKEATGHKVNYIKRHTAQPPSGDVEDTAWRYSLMNWGHDPLKG